MDNIESFDSVIIEPADLKTIEPAPEPAKSKVVAKAKKKKARVLSYNEALNIVAYEWNGIVYQSNALRYDGVSEYIEI